VNVFSPDVQWFDAFGCRFGLDLEDPDAGVLFARLYAPFAATSGPGPVFGLSSAHLPDGPAWRILRDGTELVVRSEYGRALHSLEYAVCVEVIGQRGDMLVLHGATVYAAQGCAFVTGFSEAGKTTLSLALAARGYLVGSDDVSFFDPEAGLLRPMPRCAHLSDESQQLLEGAGLGITHPLARRHGFVTPADLGGYPPPSPLRHIILLEPGVVGEDRPVLTPTTQAEAALALMREAGWENEQTPEALAALVRLAGGAEGFRLSRGRLSLMVDTVAELLGPPP
jgi:hypothetical protein